MPTRKVTPVVGLPQFDGWSHVINSTNPPGTQLVAAFAVSGRQAGNVGRALTEYINDAHVQSVTDFHDLVTSLVEESQNNGCTISFAGGVFKGPAKGAFAAYQGSVMLKRGDRFGQVAKSNKSIRIVQGSITDDDIFVLATNQTSTFLSEVEQKFTQGYEVDTIITSVVPGIHGQQDSSLSSLAFISELVERAVIVPDDGYDMESGSLSSADVHADSDDRPSNSTDNHEETDEELSDLLEDAMVTQAKNTSIFKMIFSVVMGALVIAVSWIFTTIFKLFSGLFQLLSQLVAALMTRIKQRSTSKTDSDQALDEEHSVVTDTKDDALEPNTTSSAIAETFTAPASTSVAPSMVSPVTSSTKSSSFKTFRGPTLSKLRSSNKRLIFVIGILAIFGVLIATIFITLRTRQQRVDAAQSLITPISQQNTEASLRVAESPLESRDIIAANILQLQALRQEHQDDAIMIAAIEAELAQAEALLEDISGREELAALDVFYDLRLVRSDFIASLADSDDGLAVFVDTQSKNIVLLELESKQVRFIEASDLPAIRDAIVSDGRALLLADGVQAVSMSEENEIEQLIQSGDSSSAGTLLNAYERFLYVLNPEKRHLYRYAENDGEYSEPIGWFRSSLGLDFASIRSIAIDDGVWIATEMGEIKRFVSGEEQEFAILGISEALSTPLSLVTSDQHQNLYVLEPDKSRMVILGKDGSFLREVKSPSLASATSLFVDEPMGKSFAVSGSIVFEIPL